jgi:hypothetical protein
MTMTETTTTTETPSDVPLLEAALRQNPLEDTPRYMLIDLLQESGMTLTSAQRRASDVRGEGLARLITGDTPLARKARRELLRTAECHPTLAARMRRAVICVRHDRFSPKFYQATNLKRWRSKVFDESTGSKDRVEVGALYLLKLLQRLAKPRARSTRRS